MVDYSDKSNYTLFNKINHVIKCDINGQNGIYFYFLLICPDVNNNS